MIISDYITCKDFPCTGVIKKHYVIPKIDVDLQTIRMILISEVPPENSRDYFYATNSPFYLQTTLQAFGEAGVKLDSIDDLLNRGIYLTTAVKCGKKGYSLPINAIDNCSKILEKEIDIFPNVKILMLMGDVAIRALNTIAKKRTGKKAIPSGSTYKIRKNAYFYKNYRVFPSYIITGKNFLIEKSKRRMIAEDIRKAYKLLSISHNK